MKLSRTLKFLLNHPLNRHRRVQALKRFVRWQVGSRLLPGPVVMEWVSGTRIIVRPGEYGVTQNLYCGLQDFEEMSYLMHVVTQQDLFVDVGANVGAYTILACAGKGARGICIEPIPSTFIRLLDNLFINRLLDSVRACNLGVSDADGELSFTTEEGSGNHVIDGRDGRQGSLAVPVRKLDDVLAGGAPSFLKIDVEGFETRVIGGAEATLSNPSLHSIVIELNGSGERYGFDEGAIVRKLNDFGFSSYLYHPFRRQLTRLNGKNTGDNTLFVRNIVAVQERLEQAPRVTLNSVEF